MKLKKNDHIFRLSKKLKKLTRLFSLFTSPISFFLNMGNLRKLVRLPLVGDHTKIKGKIRIENPEFIYLGSGVTIEEGVLLEGRGGIVIGDGTNIAKHTKIESTWNPQTLAAQPAFLESKAKPYATAMNTPKTTALEKGENVFFILSTGRAGSTSIAAILNQHPDIACLHEPNRLLIRLSTEYAHGTKSREEVKEELNYYYCQTSLFPGVIYGESDHKLFNLVAILAEILPKARFIWLIRNARDFVASVYGRRWFDEPYLQQRFSQVNLIEQQLIRYRINGYHCGAFTQEAWEVADSFEKICWYWHYYNSIIEKQLQGLPASRWHFIRLEELSQQLSSLLEFLEVLPVSLKKQKKNKAHYERLTPDVWNPEQQVSYEKWCKAGMEKWYSSVDEEVH